MYSRRENAFALAALAAFLVAALPENSKALGALGLWASHGLRVAFGTAAWMVPLWIMDAARRAYLREPRSVWRGFRWTFHLLNACVSFELFDARGAGGWFGAKIGPVLVNTIGYGAYGLVIMIWLVAVYRLLGPERVQQIAGHASVISSRALTQVRSARALPGVNEPLHAEVVEYHSTMGASLAPFQTQLVAPKPAAPPPLPAAPAASPKPRIPSKWNLPSTLLLRDPETRQVDRGFLADTARNLTGLLSSYSINAVVAPSSEQGPLVSAYEITLGISQTVSPIMAREEDLRRDHEGLRFVQMHGTGKLGIEIPLESGHRKLIAMREVLDSPAWTSTDAALPIALGVTTAGKPVVVDLAACPHLLVAGATGAGKSVGLNAMLTSLLLNNSPAELQLLLVDAKMVEFARYCGLPHLLAPPITEVQGAIEKLLWAVEEMENRYKAFAELKVSKIDRFNAVSKKRLPRIVIVIDEYADLTSAKKNRAQVEEAVARLAQMARGAGIHLIVATQRPSVDVIGGVIKANFPSRIAYKVSQREDSKTIIGETGAQHLIGDGDSLVMIPKLSIKPVRVHGAFIDDDEVDAVCDAWKAQTDGSQPEPAPSKLPEPTKEEAPAEEPTKADAELGAAIVVASPSSKPAPEIKRGRRDEVYESAVVLAREKGSISVRRIQEDIGCNFGNATKVFERMKAEGLIKPGGPNNTHVFVETN